MRRVFNRLDADIFVVNNVTDAGSRNEWSAMLSGGLPCTLMYITFWRPQWDFARVQGSSDVDSQDLVS